MYQTIQGRSYWLETDGAGPVLLLLHGFTGSGRTWEPLLEQWTDHFCCIRVDLPGHGRSHQETISMERFCQDLAFILNRMKLDYINLAGYSMGGRTALSFAMLFPERISKLVLESASPGLASAQERQERRRKDQKLAHQILEQGVPSFVAMWENIPLFASQKKLPDQTRRKVKEERLRQSGKGLAASLTGMGTGSQPSWWKRLGNLPQPVLLLAGAEDEKFVNIARRMDEELPGSHFQLVSHAGHAIHVEQPEKFGTIVSDFLIQDSANEEK